MCDLILGETAMRKFVIFAVLTALPNATLAEALFPRDASCTHELTVQYASCTVKTYFVCGPDAGTIRAEEVEPDKSRVALLYDRNLSLIVGGDAMGLSRTYPVQGTVISLDWDALMAGQETTYQMEMVMEMFGLTRSGPYLGKFRLGRDSIVVSEIQLVPLIEDANWELPEPIGTITGRQTHYISDDLDFPIFGEGSSSMKGNNKSNGKIPAEILFPGDPGFESEQPKYGCPGLSSLSGVMTERPA
jgi:hypothetical protein